jgi:subtilisin family serine protease
MLRLQPHSTVAEQFLAEATLAWREILYPQKEGATMAWKDGANLPLSPVPPDYRPRVVVKFKDDAGFADPVQSYVEGAEREIKERRIAPWDDLPHPDSLTLKPLFVSASPAQIQALTTNAERLTHGRYHRNLLTYFAIECPPDLVDPDKVRDVLSKWPAVEVAYVESRVAPPPAIVFADAIAEHRYQHKFRQVVYHQAIETEFAWGFAGGYGEGIGFLDIEQGWDFKHEDFKNSIINPNPLYGQNCAYFGHGTSVLGEVLAGVNQVGGVGIAPGVNGMTASILLNCDSPGDLTHNTHDVILASVSNHLKFGDVLLLECQTSNDLPSEIEPAVFDAVLCAATNGIIVVEPAGNAQTDLDVYQFLPNAAAPEWVFPLPFRTSGAIMVGASELTPPYQKAGFSNYGSRVNCFAPGVGIDTAGNGHDEINDHQIYTDGLFCGTSAAAPIVAAAAISIQGIVSHRNGGARIGPGEMRELLSDRSPGLNTPSASPNDKIGVMPNLRNLLTQKLNIHH